MLLLLLSHFSRVRLCDPIDGCPPGSPVPGILQARTLEWAAISFSNACIHAKSLQSCLTLCDPMDSSPPDSPVHRILQARTLEWVAISFSNSVCYSIFIVDFCTTLCDVEDLEVEIKIASGLNMTLYPALGILSCKWKTIRMLIEQVNRNSEKINTWEAIEKDTS